MLSFCIRPQLMITSHAQSDRRAKLEHGKTLLCKDAPRLEHHNKATRQSPRLSACGVSVVAYTRDSADEKHNLADGLFIDRALAPSSNERV